MIRSRRVVVTGVGALLAGCESRGALWTQLSEGRSQLQLEPNPARPSETLAIGRVKADPRRFLEGLPERRLQGCSRDQLLYLASLCLARVDARVRADHHSPDRVGLFDGTSRDNFAFWHERTRREPLDDFAELYGRRELIHGMPAHAVGLGAALFGVQGPAYTFNATCSSGAVAIGHALREIADGRIDLAFATGHDSVLIPPFFQLYGSAGLLSTEHRSAATALRPYGGATGNVFGEGAVTLVLESEQHARRRGATILAELCAFGYGNFGAHPTQLDETGGRPAQVIAQALDEAHVRASDVRFVLGHGNGVDSSDRSELAMMQRLFGERARKVPLISVKPIYGHTLGASSALNVAAAVLMVSHRRLVPTLNQQEPSLTGFNHVPRAVADPCEVGVCSSYGMGGHNAVIVVRRSA